MVTEIGNKDNARLRVFRAIADANLGITPGMERGHLYHHLNDSDELALIGRMLGLNPLWMKNRGKGLAHYDLWGAPLERAKRLFKVVTREEMSSDLDRIGSEIKEYQSEFEKETKAEYVKQDAILQNIGYVCFVSKSKGRSRGRGRPRGERRVRRAWKEIELYRYAGSPWRTEGKAKFDEVAQELERDKLIQGEMGGDGLMWWVKEHCNRKGGAHSGIH